MARAPAAGGPTDAVLDAARHIEKVRTHLGEQDFAIVHWIVVEDVSWRELGRRLNVSAATAKLRAIEALKRLAEV